MKQKFFNYGNSSSTNFLENTTKSSANEIKPAETKFLLAEFWAKDTEIQADMVTTDDDYFDKKNPIFMICQFGDLENTNDLSEYISDFDKEKIFEHAERYGGYDEVYQIMTIQN